MILNARCATCTSSTSLPMLVLMPRYVCVRLRAHVCLSVCLRVCLSVSRCVHACVCVWVHSPGPHRALIDDSIADENDE